MTFRGLVGLYQFFLDLLRHCSKYVQPIKALRSIWHLGSHVEPAAIPV